MVMMVAPKERYSEIVSIVSKRLKLIQRFEASSLVLFDPWQPASDRPPQSFTKVSTLSAKL